MCMHTVRLLPTAEGTQRAHSVSTTGAAPGQAVPARAHTNIEAGCAAPADLVTSKPYLPAGSESACLQIRLSCLGDLRYEALTFLC